MADTAAQVIVNPADHSSDYKAQALFWKMVNDILGGAETMRAISYGGNIGGQPIAFDNQTQQQFSQMRGIEAESPYLPKFPNEEYIDYDRRRRNAFFTNIYGDISRNLASKPFSQELVFSEGTPDDIVKLGENIDGLGNSMHVFAQNIFKIALDKSITWILCDYTTVPPGSTLEYARKINARPYWVNIPTEKLIAVYSKFLNGAEVIFHARIEENCIELDGYKEVEIKRVRVLNREPITRSDTDDTIVDFAPATWQIYQEDITKDAAGKEVSTWNIVDSGSITIGIIPLVPLILGKRDGTSWRVEPLLRDLTYMQVKLFQMESNLDSIKELTAFPMLSGDGIRGTDETGTKIKVPVGPRGVLFSPPDANGNAGSWKFIEPAASSLTFLQQDIEKHKTEMRDLGMQPLTAANLTVVTTANLSMKANSAMQAMAITLEDALEQAWKITVMWLKKPVEPQVDVYKDFAVKLEDGAELSAISTARTDGIISKKLYFSEFKRRGVLAEDADWSDDQEQQAKEQSNEVLTPEKHIDPITGMPVVVTPKFGKINPPPQPQVTKPPFKKAV